MGAEGHCRGGHRSAAPIFIATTRRQLARSGDPHESVLWSARCGASSELVVPLVCRCSSLDDAASGGLAGLTSRIALSPLGRRGEFAADAIVHGIGIAAAVVGAAALIVIAVT